MTMTLPALPAENEDPWYAKRAAFDLAVKTDLEGRLSDASLSTTFVAIDRQVHFALDHGIVANGTTDDAGELNALIAAVSTAGGGTVRLPDARTIRVNSQIIMAANVTLEGGGWHTIISLGANLSSGSGVIRIGAVANVTVRNLKVECARVTNTNTISGVYAPAPGGFTNLTIDRVWVNAAHYVGILILGSSTRATTTKTVRITDCKTTDTGASGILCQWAVDDCVIDRCTVLNYGQLFIDVLNSGVGITNGRFAYDTRVTNNTIDGTGALGTSAHAISIDTPYGGFVCSNNTIAHAQGYGIELGAVTNGTCTGNSITGGPSSGIAVTSFVGNEQKNQGFTIADNVVTGCAGSGIYTFTGDPTANMETPATQTRLNSSAVASGVRIVHEGRLYQCTTAGTTASSEPSTLGNTATAATITDGTVVWTDRGGTNQGFTITGNVVRRCGAAGIEIRYSHLFSILGNEVYQCGLSGIYVDQNANMYSIEGNDLEGNNLAADSAHGNIRLLFTAGISRQVRVAGNRAHNAGVAGGDRYYTEGSSVRVDNRLTPNAFAPSVAIDDVYRTQNAAPTSVQYLNDANANARQVTIFVNDAFTTFVHTASGNNSIRLVGGTNYAAPSGAVLQFAFVANQWREVSRSLT
jgi:hypothetical protein